MSNGATPQQIVNADNGWATLMKILSLNVPPALAQSRNSRNALDRFMATFK